MDILIVILFSYLCGSIPFGLILTKYFANVDVRKIGSGNIGATNVLRTGNKSLAAATLILDVIKGYVPVLITMKYSKLDKNKSRKVNSLEPDMYETLRLQLKYYKSELRHIEKTDPLNYQKIKSLRKNILKVENIYVTLIGMMMLF